MACRESDNNSTQEIAARQRLAQLPRQGQQARQAAAEAADAETNR